MLWIPRADGLAFRFCVLSFLILFGNAAALAPWVYLEFFS